MDKRKFLWSTMAALLVAMMSFGFVACGDDDDDDSGSGSGSAKATVTVGSQKFSTNHAYWYYYTKHAESQPCHLVFASFDMLNVMRTHSTNLPSKFSCVYIEINAPQSSSLPEGTYTDFSFFAVQDVTVNPTSSDPGYQYEKIGAADGGTDATLTITKSGSNYNISIDNMTVVKFSNEYDDDVVNPAYDDTEEICNNVSFKFSGPITTVSDPDDMNLFED